MKKTCLFISLIFITLIATTRLSKPVSAQSEEIRIATWNLEWFNDHITSDDDSTIGRDFAAPDKTEYRERVKVAAEAIETIDPMIIALQEVENERVVSDIAKRLQDEHGLAYQVAFVQGTDRFTGQDVAFLVRDDVLFEESRYNFRSVPRNGNFKDVSKHLKIDILIGDETLTVVTVHLVTNSDDRKRQALTLRTWIENTTTQKIIILGDFNADQRFNQTTPNSDMGIIRGFQTDSSTDDLFDAHQLLANRGTHVSDRELDRILVSQPLLDDDGLQLVSATTDRKLAIRGDEDRSDGVSYRKPTREQDLSDHYPLIATFTLTSQSTAPTEPPAETGSMKADLLQALERIEEEILRLSIELDEIREQIEALEE